MPEARVILALAAEAEGDFIWSNLEDIIQTNMYSAGPLSVKLLWRGGCACQPTAHVDTLEPRLR
jgi:hypothetical protein